MQKKIKPLVMIGVITFSLIGTRMASAQVSPASQIIAPTAYTTQLGSSNEQSVSVLGVKEQSGSQNNPDSYISFNTPGSVYSGIQTFQLPLGVNGSSISTLKLIVNFNGPLGTTQRWKWSLYNYTTKSWSAVGSNSGVTQPNTWTLLKFSITNPAQFINANGVIRVSLRSNNAGENARVDYEVLLFTTSSPTATPTGILPTPIPSETATATPVPSGTFFVSPSGNDNNPGTEVKPWRTIQKAANTVTAGNTVLVQAGNYAERVTLNRSGSAGSPITFAAQGTVVMRGFTVRANYVTIRGFEITNTLDNATDGWGIWVKGSRCRLENNYIHYATRGGILLYVEPGYETLTANCVVRNNRLYKNSQLGIEVRGRKHLIERNEIWGTIQHHPGMAVQPSYVDADGIRFHGSGHVFRGNYIHDILYSAVENVDAHIDCFQTFKALPYQEAANNVTFERNRCDNAQSQSSLQVGKGFMLQNATNIIIRNNIIKAYVGINANTSSNSLTIVNNTFTSNVTLTTANSPSGITLDGVSIATIKNNIFFNLPGQIIFLTRSAVSAGKNLMYRNDGKALVSSSTYSHVNDLWGINPQFVSTTDFHLSAGSPAIDAGLVVSVSDDFDGTSRPRGAGYDIGAFER